MGTNSLPVLAVILASIAFAATANGSGNVSMDPEMQEIENVRNAHEREIMSIDGVVLVGIGLGKDGKPCLKIGTSVPPETVRDSLPAEIFKVCVEIEHVGEIRPQ